jgi:spore coat polysaccharide biosynthesis protein SpsF
MLKSGSVVAIIQARMGAARLPNKMMLHLHGYPICEWVFRRVSSAKHIDNVVFALPDTSQDDLLEKFLNSIGANTIRGSETDLISRFVKASQKTSADYIVRICADNPLICASEIDRLVEFYNDEVCDYAYNHIPKNNHYPDGLGAEICAIKILKEINEKATKIEHREHLFNYIWDNHTDYIIKTFEPPKELAYSELKLDVDSINDYKKLLEKQYRIDMSAQQVVNLALEK